MSGTAAKRACSSARLALTVGAVGCTTHGPTLARVNRPQGPASSLMMKPLNLKLGLSASVSQPKT
eukprot:4958326-Pleurochrysis_carterae.AAC.1